MTLQHAANADQVIRVPLVAVTMCNHVSCPFAAAGAIGPNVFFTLRLMQPQQQSTQADWLSMGVLSTVLSTLLLVVVSGRAVEPEVCRLVEPAVACPHLAA